MPRNMIFRIGDIVNDAHFGFGIIVGQKPLTDSKRPDVQYYHVYYFDSKVFLYRMVQSLSIHAFATDESRMQVQNIVLTELVAKKSNSRYQIGDVMLRYNKRLLILDNGHILSSKITPNHKILYHTYDTTNNMLSYNEFFLGDLLNRIPATIATKQEAVRFIINNIFSQLF